MAYPDHNKPFELYTDASDYQMGAAILQDGRPVAYWSRKLNSAQRGYTTMEKELLAVVMCCNEFRSMLLGANITVFTDHKNLTFRTLNPQRVLRWRLFLEDFNPTFRYIPGKENVLADCFSRLPRMSKVLEGGNGSANKGTIVDFNSLKPPEDPDDQFHIEETVLDANTCADFLPYVDPRDPEVFESFLNLPTLEEMDNPVTMHRIQEEQFEDQDLNERMRQNTSKFIIQYIQEKPIICIGSMQDWKIALPITLIKPIIRWYHKVLGHCGKERLYETISSRFFAPGLYTAVQQYDCDDCQRYKLLGAGYGLLPPREAKLAPWDEVAIDLIGPWKIELPNKSKVEIMALTCIDTVTNLVESSEFETRRRLMSPNNFAMYGCQDIPNQTDASMIMEASSLAKRFN